MPSNPALIEIVARWKELNWEHPPPAHFADTLSPNAQRLWTAACCAEPPPPELAKEIVEKGITHIKRSSLEAFCTSVEAQLQAAEIMQVPPEEKPFLQQVKKELMQDLIAARRDISNLPSQ